MEKFPLVSVVLPVYNGESYLEEALNSLSIQSYPNFEVILINDGSDDSSLEILEAYKMPNFHVYSQKNQGLPLTLNRGIELSNGIFIARMDQDDISAADRLEAQVSYLREHQEIGVLGTGYKLIDLEGDVIGYRRPICDSKQIERLCYISNPLVHGSVMFRKSLIKDVKFYSIEEKAEDYFLWSKLIRITKIENLPEFLYYYRYQRPDSMVNRNPNLYSLSRTNIQNKMWDGGRIPSPWVEGSNLNEKINYLLKLNSQFKNYKNIPKLKYNRSERDYFLITGLGIAKEARKRKLRKVMYEEYLFLFLVNCFHPKNLAKITYNIIRDFI